MTFGNGTDVNDVIGVYDKDRAPLVDGVAEVGQFVLTVTPDFSHPLKIFDAQRSDQVSHSSVSGVIRDVDASKDFLRSDRLSILKLGLGSFEEILAIKAKARRCLVLARTDGIPDQHLPPADRGIARPAFQRPCYFVAPAYSVASPGHARAITQTIAARAECMVYPNLIFLPRSGGIIREDSVVRLDRAFWTTLSPPTEFYKLFLSGQRLGMVQSQIQVLQGLDPDPEYIEMVELLRGELAPEHATHLP
ncbi:hypothetical protein [Xanthomonas phaseoli]|uniref:hypothetical protein n=1 Tax=Xanthomonas phaseoli TaxID=1985254 RepID=UPI001E5CB38A|nr:hypothetical protein [Xanthomonas phaseoli]MCC8471217.1 hypothetical protein [Xanthomonas phaseoli]